MIIVIPLGGIGKRFSDLGYTDPKPLIKVLGKEIIFWVLDNLRLKSYDKLYIVYNNQLDKYKFTEFFGKYPSVNFLKLNKKTQGPIETIYELTKILGKNYQNEGLLILDGDTFYKKNIINLINKKENTIFYHTTKILEPIFSYIKVKNKRVYKIAEKKKISSNANTGAYYFNNISTFNIYAKNKLKKNKKAYVSDVFNDLLNDGQKIKGQKLKNSEFACLGTPRQVKDFCNQKKFEKKRFCFDLDNTLVTYPKIPNDYNSVKPIIKNIKFLNFLYSLGHYIIIYTARRMRTHNGNISKVKKEIEQLTLNQLKMFKINYNEIVFGKPYANFYIDDLSIHPNENLNTKLGYYEISENQSRNFNEIIIGEKFTIKNSTNTKILKNEIFFLQNIPKKIKNYFPNILDHGKNFYKMETVNGLKLSYLLINKLFTKDDLTILFKTINQIHYSQKNKLKPNINIYENYSKKLLARIKKTKNSVSLISNKKFIKINDYLINYEKNDSGKIGLIHGDPILSNIIKKNNNDLVFLDPRGSLGFKSTLFGDTKYDFAKIYQSLTGYENIIMEKKTDDTYLNDLRIHYENLLIKNKKINDVKELKYLTASLYISLINFHDKKFTNKFLDLSFDLI